MPNDINLKGLHQFLDTAKLEVQKLLGLIENPKPEQVSWAVALGTQSRRVAVLFGFKEIEDGPHTE